MTIKKNIWFYLNLIIKYYLILFFPSFTIANEKGLLLGFSLQGKQIPKSTSLKINENILFSVYGKRNKDFINQEITLKTTLAGRKGNKVNTKVNKYIYTSKNN